MHKNLTIPTGLHCHDNLALGMANVLKAIDCGAERIDSTLQGMGRGGGNPATEVLVTVLKKRGITLGIDVNRLMDVSQQLVKPMLKDKGWDPINITSGYAGFHSSYLTTILKYADLYDIDPRDLIVGVCEVDQVHAPDNLVDQIAKKLHRGQTDKSGVHMISLPQFIFPRSPVPEKREPLVEAAKKIAQESKTTAIKKRRKSVFNIVAAPHPCGMATVSRFIQEEFDYVICSAEIDSLAHLEQIIHGADGIIDIFLIDVTPRLYLESSLLFTAKTLVKNRLAGWI